MRTIVWLGCWLLMAQALAEPYVPPVLEPWRQWVLEAHPELPCPIAGPASQRLCQWPSDLRLEIGAERGEFSLRATLYAPGWLALPGDAAAWPVAVSAGGKALAVQRQQERPAVYLPAGEVNLQGHWQWRSPPRSLAVPADTGRVSLRVSGNPVATPRWTSEGKLLLQVEPTAAPSATDQHGLAVYRLLEDGLPQTLTTRLLITVSGRARTLTLGPVLPAGFRATALDSPLPSQLDAQGRLTLEARPGQWPIIVRALRSEPAETLAINTAEGWPEQELWAFAAAPQVRTVRVSGAPQVDAQEANMPSGWRQHPIYLLNADTALELEVVQRGATEAAPRLRLSRTLWWDFAGGGATARDVISGDAAHLTRLEAEPPLELSRAELNGEPLLLTRRSPEAPVGVELRAGQLNLTAVSRLPPVDSLPVGGWQQDFEQVDYQLSLPPGWRALHLAGPEQVHGTWLSQWNLWNIFSVLIIAIGLGRVAGRAAGLLALATLVFTYHRPGAPLLGWVVLLGALALAPHIKGAGRRWLALALGVGLLVTVLPLLPHSVSTVRQLLYPQLHSLSPAATAFDEVATSGEAELSRRAAMDYARPELSAAPPARAPAPQRYQAKQDPNARIQAGPGLPEWRGAGISAHWPGPVAAGETLRWWLAPPWLTGIGLALSLVLPWALLAWLGRLAWPRLAELRADGPLPAAAAAALLLAVSLGQSPPARAELHPELLQQLETRLTRPPACAPDCANLTALRIAADATELTLTFTVNMSAAAAVRLPLNSRDWQPRSLSLPYGAAPPLSMREGRLWVALPEGIHQLSLSGPAPAERLELQFDTPPTNVTQELTGWTLSGLQKDSLTLQLERVADTASTVASERSSIAPYALITRRLELNVDWRVVTHVQRLAPETGALALTVPLLAGEVPQGELNVSDGAVRLQLADGQREFSWSSALPVGTRLALTAPAGAPWTERWEVYAAPIWHFTFTGPPPTEAGAERLYFQPEPGEALEIEVSRPAAVPGSALALDRVQLISRPGRDLTELDFNLTLRATYGSEVSLPLPPGSEVISVALNGAALPAKREGDSLRLPLAPGTHRAEIKLRYPTADQWVTRTPALSLPATAANIELTVQLPRGRWPLWVAGPKVGPEILFWSVTALVLALAIALARFRRTPLKLYEWALLSLGVATINIYLIALIALWLAAFQWRGSWSNPPRRDVFKLWQLGLAGLGGLAVLALVLSIPYSLLAAPEMYVTGNQSSAYDLRWYQDRVESTLPAAQVVSAPLLAYRLLMLAWSIWLAFALIRWIGWSWRQWSSGGIWPPRPARPSMPVPAVLSKTDSPVEPVSQTDGPAEPAPK